MKTAKLKVATALLLMIASQQVSAQEDKAMIKQGNDAYKKADYPAATQAYGKVVAKDPENATAQYNLGNALYKSQKTEEAVAAYDRSIATLTKPIEKSNAYYNKGVVLHNNQKIPECIEAYKSALKLDPNNEDARQNLQKALRQQKQQQEQDKKDKKNEDKDQDKQKNKDQQKQPKPQQSRITKKEAEEKLKALMQKEKNLQDKLRKVSTASPDRPEKDW